MNYHITLSCLINHCFSVSISGICFLYEIISLISSYCCRYSDDSFFILWSISVAVLLENVVDPQNWNRKRACQLFRNFFCCFSFLPQPCVLFLLALFSSSACPSDSHHSELSCSSDCVCPAIPSCLLEVLPLLYM